MNLDTRLLSSRKQYETIENTMKLRDYQEDGIKFLLSRKYALLGDEPGLGKTAQAITAAQELAWESAVKLNVLVLCPKSVVFNWTKEIAKWTTIKWVCDWRVINWDKLVQSKFVGELALEDYDLVIADECHTALKSWTAKRCMNFLNFLYKTVDRVWFMSATPATRSAADYHPVLSMLQPGKWGKFSEFRKKHCIEKVVTIKNWKTHKSFKKTVYVGFKDTQTIKDAFKVCALKRYKKDVAKELPPTQRIKIYVEPNKKLIAESLNIDDRIVKDCVERGVSLPSHIASVVRTIGQAKLDAALDWISSFPEDEPLVIFAWHQDVVVSIRNGITNLDQACEMITGSTNMSDRQIRIESFRKGALKRIVLNMQSGGTGIDGLQVASNALFIEFPWSPTTLHQAEGRIDRLGSKGECINYYQMIASGTIDEVILNSVCEKQEGINEVGI